MRVKNKLTVALLVLLPMQGSTLPWSKDMQDQPTTKAQETVVSMAESSVRANSPEPIQRPSNISDLVLQRIAAGENLTNPLPASSNSVNHGREIYRIHCATCHGDQGTGDGLVGQKFVPTPIDLTVDYIQIQPDGRLYYTITYGGIAMPDYQQSIAQIDRWHLVNYIKNSLKPAQ
ncbi:MAG TPA: cytochrome c [Alphaproteobacteria bacterium]|nr:cytochrome c [Alphaproteobacteria bacterium]